ncbi:hypothetical protein WMF26_32050 [Sorangium sp. So ce185]|uniref:hypothetical protein n=1 Tax=Sorangium sp. So ce185 TaxID=3133287 RepID=UPI003F62C427
MRRIEVTWVFGALLALLPACGSGSAPPTAADLPAGAARSLRGAIVDAPLRPDLSTLPATMLASPRCDPVIRQDVLRVMAHNDLGHNALAAEALKSNAGLREALTKRPLNSATFKELDENVAFKQEETANETDELLKYVVSCALAPGDSVESRHANGGAWSGELGLCSDWKDRPPSLACQELVSSCVLARVNARGKRVPISLRGDSECLLPLRDKVPVETQFREKDGTTIWSFEKCAQTPAPKDPRPCGWHPLYVGTCLSGTTVTVRAKIPFASKRRVLPMLRVCAGIYGCNDPRTPRRPGEHVQYSEFLASTPELSVVGRNNATFTCPSNGPRFPPYPIQPLSGQQIGYFSLMSSEEAQVDIDVEATRLASIVKDPLDLQRKILKYPAPETAIFSFPEGAFYGNLFRRTPVNVTLGGRSVPGLDPKLQFARLVMLSENMHACYDKGWSSAVEPLTDRMCTEVQDSSAASSETTCFENVPGPCSGQPGGRCAKSDVGSGDAYDDCSSDDGKTMWRSPITTYVNHPCDLSKDWCYQAPQPSLSSLVNPRLLKLITGAP